MPYNMFAIRVVLVGCRMGWDSSALCELLKRGSLSCTLTRLKGWRCGVIVISMWIASSSLLHQRIIKTISAAN
jgi:hypothetical protein